MREAVVLAVLFLLVLSIHITTAGKNGLGKAVRITKEEEQLLQTEEQRGELAIKKASAKGPVKSTQEDTVKKQKEMKRGMELRAQFPHEQQLPSKSAAGQFGVVYIVFGNSQEMLSHFRIMLRYLNLLLQTAFEGHLPLYKGHQVSFNLICSPTSCPVLRKLLKDDGELRALAKAVELQIMEMWGSLPSPEGKATRMYAQRFCSPVQYALFLDLDSFPRPGFLRLFDYLTEEGYDVVDSYSRFFFGQSEVIGIDYSMGFLQAGEETTAFLHYSERNGGTIAANLHSPAVLNMLELEFHLVQLYTAARKNIGDQHGLRVALFASTHLWTAPYALRERTLSCHTEICRLNMDAPADLQCLIYHPKLYLSRPAMVTFEQGIHRGIIESHEHLQRTQLALQQFNVSSST